jgi:hypothetical protein
LHHVDQCGLELKGGVSQVDLRSRGHVSSLWSREVKDRLKLPCEASLLEQIKNQDKLLRGH